MIIQSSRSPNFDPDPIPVEFVVIHYTACDLARTLEIFTDTSSSVSAHLVIAEDGEVFELVECLDGNTLRARHAGASQWVDGERVWNSLNNCSIGIELVNFNGNVFPYTEEQYQSLAHVMRLLMPVYPNLQSATRVLGHEQIAGYRGKIDPGAMFNWPHFFELVYPDATPPVRGSICPSALLASLRRLIGEIPDDTASRSRFWEALSNFTETSVRLIHEADLPP